MKTRMLWFVAMMTALSSLALAQQKNDLDKLTAELIRIARPAAGMGEDEQSLAKEFALGDKKAAVRALIPLLKHEKKGVPRLAGYVILECSAGVVPEQLDALIEGYLNGSGWLPSVIGRIGNAKAIRFLADDFLRNPQTHAQVSHTLAQLGPKAMPYLLHHFDVVDLEKRFDYYQGLKWVIKEMGVDAESAVAGLLKIAKDKKRSMKRRKCAVLLLGSVGPSAEPALLQLRRLWSEDKQEWAEVLDSAIIDCGGRHAAIALVRQLNAGTGEYSILDIGMLGDAAHHVGPQVMPWLASGDGQSRVATITTIGDIGYQAGASRVTPFLEVKTDWRQAYAAAYTLAKLRHRPSLPALKSASKAHWFPPVRDLAQKAIQVIENGENFEEVFGCDGIGVFGDVLYDLTNYKKNDVVPPDLGDLAPVSSRNEDFHAFEVKHPKIAAEFIRLRDTNGVQFLKMGQMESLQLAGGTLLGAHAGEWYGGFQYVPTQGKQVSLLSGNVYGLAKWNGHILAAEGIMHMGMNDGMIYKVTANEHTATIQPWFTLPACPQSMSVTKTGKLIIVCDQGVVVLSKQGGVDYYRLALEQDVPPLGDDER
ncbi:MAG: hypothetical protein H7A51_15315 [Akkermansiaceae bacterium]|nr:hypothetical protein [Akkermansiaceae bacterium]